MYGVPENAVVVTCGRGAGVCPGVGEVPQRTYYYLFKYDPDAEDDEDAVPQMTGEDLKLSGTRSDFDPQTGQPQVLMEFTDSGGDKFQRITRDEWSRGKIRGAPQHFAIVLDREIKSFPQIDPSDSTLSNGIGGGSARITGIDSVDESKNLAIVLQTGALPIEFQTLSTTEIRAPNSPDPLEKTFGHAFAFRRSVMSRDHFRQAGSENESDGDERCSIWSRRPARIARSASSSCACATPNAASTASPANFSTMPPCVVTQCEVRSKNRVTRRRTTSGSCPETSNVDPTRSTNNTVASLRSIPSV